jgi:hypothetical protein
MTMLPTSCESGWGWNWGQQSSMGKVNKEMT